MILVEREAVEQRDAADEASASDGASPLISVFGGHAAVRGKERLDIDSVVPRSHRALWLALGVPGALLLGSWLTFYIAWEWFPEAWHASDALQLRALFWAKDLPLFLFGGATAGFCFIVGLGLLRRREVALTVLFGGYCVGILVAMLIGSVVFVPFKIID